MSHTDAGEEERSGLQYGAISNSSNESCDPSMYKVSNDVAFETNIIIAILRAAGQDRCGT